MTSRGRARAAALALLAALAALTGSACSSALPVDPTAASGQVVWLVETSQGDGSPYIGGTASGAAVGNAVEQVTVSGESYFDPTVTRRIWAGSSIVATDAVTPDAPDRWVQETALKGADRWVLRPGPGVLSALAHRSPRWRAVVEDLSPSEDCTVPLRATPARCASASLDFATGSDLTNVMAPMYAEVVNSLRRLAVGLTAGDDLLDFTTLDRRRVIEALDQIVVTATRYVQDGKVVALSLHFDATTLNELNTGSGPPISVTPFTISAVIVPAEVRIDQPDRSDIATGRPTPTKQETDTPSTNPEDR